MMHATAVNHRPLNRLKMRFVTMNSFREKSALRRQLDSKEQPPPLGRRFEGISVAVFYLGWNCHFWQVGMLLPDQFILAAAQQPSHAAHLSKVRQRWIEVHTRIWQVELR